MRSRWLWFRRTVLVVAVTTGCPGGGDGPGIVNGPVVVSVAITTPAVKQIDIGANVQLNATVTVQNGASQSVEWSAAPATVATVSQSGLVTGVAGGQATITAKSIANASKSDAVTITVNPARVVGVTLNSGARSIRVGENFTVSATVETLGPLARTVNFSSSDPTKATVSSADNITATVVGVSAGGPVTITATSTVDPSKSVALPVTVTGTVRIPSASPSPVNIRVGAQVKLTPTVQADAGLSSAVTYTSQSSAIATVAADGTVTGIAVGGTSVIIRSVGDPTVSLTVPVTVRSGVTSVNLTPDRDSLRRGVVHQFATNVVAETGASTALNLSSANPAIATIDASARVTAVAVGQTFVRAISAVDPTIGDSTLVVVRDPCIYHQPLTFGTAVAGSVSALSCNGTDELFAYQVTSQTMLIMAATVQFPANYTFIFDKTGGYYFSLAAGASGATTVVAAPARYAVGVTATNINQRGTFTVSANTTNSPGTACGAVATTGVTVPVPMNVCGFQPQGRPAGSYSSFNFGVLPFLQAGQTITITATAPAPIVPLVEVKFGASAPIQAIATGQTLVQTFTAPTGGAFVQFTLSTRDAGQNGTYSVKIEGPPSLSYDAFVFGSGVAALSEPTKALTPPDRRLVPFTNREPVRP